MRSTTAAEDTVLNAANRSHHLKVEVANADGTLKDLTDLGGTDWVTSVQWGETVDQPVPQATIKLRRDTQGLTNSLSPLATGSALNVNNEGSYAALVDVGRRIRISVATLAFGATPTASDYQLMFDGVIDEVGWGKPDVEVVARDRIMAELADRWVESETVYGSDEGDPLEDVIQALVLDWTDLYKGPVNLEEGLLAVTGNPSFRVLTYEQQKMSVLQAVQTLAQLIGWDVRSRWNEAANKFRLTLYQPDRSPASADWTFGQSDVLDYRRLDLDRSPVRNVVVIRYTSSTATAGPVRTKVTALATGSIARFGRRWMEIEEASDSSIDTAAEAQTFASSALSDLSSPQADQEMETLFFWPLELQDYLEFSAGDGTHYTTDQTLGVYGFQHKLSGGGRVRERTTIQTRGNPAGQYLAWHRNFTIRRPRTPEERANDVRLVNFRRKLDTSSSQVDLLWDWHERVEQVWIHDQAADEPEVSDVFAAFASSEPSTIVDRASAASYTANFPTAGQVRLIQMEPRSETMQAGPIVRIVVTPQPWTEVADVPDGSFVASKLVKSAQGFSSNITFSATDADTVKWTAGSIKVSDGTTYAIASGNTGDMVGLNYIYLSPTATTALQTSTSFDDAVDDEKILMAVAKNVTAGDQAFFVPAVGVLGLSGDQIAPNSIKTNLIQANAITAAKINAAAVETAKLDAGAVTATKVSANAITAGKINVSSLSAISADMGVLTAGRIVSGNITISASGETITFGSGVTAPDTGTGIYLGLATSDGEYHGRFGTPTGENLHWDGSSLNIDGRLTGKSFSGTHVLGGGLQVDGLLKGGSAVAKQGAAPDAGAIDGAQINQVSTPCIVGYSDYTTTSGSPQGIEAYITTRHSAGTLALAIAGINHIDHMGDGDITQAQCARGFGILRGGGTIAELSSFAAKTHIELGGPTGSVTDAIGLLAEAQTIGASNNWSIKAEGDCLFETEVEIDGAIDHDGSQVGFFDTALATQRALSTNASNADIVQVLRAYGLTRAT